MSLLLIYPLSIASNSFIIPNSYKSQNKPKLEEVVVEWFFESCILISFFHNWLFDKTV